MLQSQLLFKGDAKLEAAANWDAAHIIRGRETSPQNPTGPQPVG